MYRLFRATNERPTYYYPQTGSEPTDKLELQSSDKIQIDLGNDRKCYYWFKYSWPIKFLMFTEITEPTNLPIAHSESSDRVHT